MDSLLSLQFFNNYKTSPLKKLYPLDKLSIRCDKIVINQYNVRYIRRVTVVLTKIWRDIDKGNLQPVYLIKGEEAYLADETLRKIKTALSQQEEAEMITYSLDETPVEDVLTEADTFPFFTEHKCIIAKNASFLKASDRDKEKVKHDLTKLEAYLKKPATFSVVVFIAPYEKLDERKKVTKWMKEYATLVEAVVPEERDLAIWLHARAKQLQTTITDDAIGLLMSMVGTNMLQLNLEIEKLGLYVGKEGIITEQAVQLLVAKTLEQDAFKMVDAYFEHDTETALTIYRDLILQKQEPIMLVGLLASTIRTMNQTYYLQTKGYTQHQIAKQLKIHPYRVKLMLEKRKRPSEEQLLRALYALANVDLALKTTGGNRERQLELFLLRQI